MLELRFQLGIQLGKYDGLAKQVFCLPASPQHSQQLLHLRQPLPNQYGPKRNLWSRNMGLLPCRSLGGACGGHYTT